MKTNRCERPQLGRRYYKPKSSTCCICKRPVIHISKIKIVGNKFIYHCQQCKKEAEELAEITREDYYLC